MFDLKKKHIIILTAALVLAAAAVTALIVININPPDAQTASGGPAVTVGTVTAKPGDTVQVPVSYTGNPGTMGVQLEIEYDGEALTYLGYDRGDIISDCEVSETNGKLTLIGINDNDTDKNGTLIYLNFKVGDSASGKTEIKLGSSILSNYNEETINAEFKNGGVTVE